MKYLRSQPASVKQKSYCTQAPGELSFIIFIVEGHYFKIANHFIIQHSLQIQIHSLN